MISVYTLCENSHMTTLGSRLREAREAAGFKSARAAAIRHGWKVSTYSAHENGQNEYGPDEAKSYSKAFKTKASWLLTNEGEPPARKHAPQPDIEPEFLGDFGSDDGGIVEIDVRAGMGAGEFSDREVRVNGELRDRVKSESWHFPETFVRGDLRSSPNRIIIAETQGDSMLPTIQPGERVVIDTAHNLPSPDGIYAIRDRYEGIQVKRLQVLRRGDPPRILIISDNEAHPNEEVGADEIAIVGRVICSLRRL